MAERTNKSMEGSKVSPSLAPFDATIEETWKKVILDGEEQPYEVSNFGRLRTLRNSSSHKAGELLHPTESKHGYLRYYLSANGMSKSISAHRAVAIAFVPNELNLPEINHKDEDKTNNRADNLEWCNRVYNVKYGTGQKRSQEQLPRKRICQFNREGLLIRVWRSVSDAAANMKIDGACIVRSANQNKMKTFHGYIWLYEDDPNKERKLSSIVDWLSRGRNMRYGKKTIVGAYDDNWRLRKIFPSMRYAEKYGFKCANISRAIKKGQKHYGYNWALIDNFEPMP